MEALRQDLKSAFAVIRRAPAFAATAVLTLALGIGAATAVFSVLQGVLLRPLPYADPNQLVRIWEEHPGGVSPAGNRWLSRGTYAVWRDGAQTLDALGGYAISDYRVDIADKALKVTGAQVSPALLDTLGAAPALGRVLTDDDDRSGASPVVVLSHRWWRERFGADAAVVGTSLVINERPHTIVGVARQQFAFPDPQVQFWLPYVIPRASDPSRPPFVFTAVARMKPGVTAAQVAAEGTASARSIVRPPIMEFFFGIGGPVVVQVRPLADDVTAPVRPALSVLAAAVALVLLIACANVTNLMLSRGAARQRELAIRAAIGGSRRRIVQQLFTENAVFAVAGGAMGWLLGSWLVRLLPAVAPARLPRLEEIALDGSVMALCALATLVAAVISCLVPAARAARVDVFDAFRGADGVSSSGFRGVHARRLRNSVLVVEAAFAVILIVGASLLARSFVRLIRVDNGYRAEGVLVAAVELPGDTSEARTDEFIETTLRRLRTLPRVSAAGASAMIPLMPRTAVTGIALPQSIAGGKQTHGRALVYWITPGYAEAIGLRLKHGRFFERADVGAGRLLTIVNEEFVRQHLREGPVVGLTIPKLLSEPANTTAEIVGVVGNVLKDGNDREPQPELYFVHGSHGQRIIGRVNLVIRTEGALTALAPEIRAIVAQIEPGALVERIEPLTMMVAASLETPRFAAGVMTAFATAALVLAAIGLYGVVSYGVSQRTRELGIRAALGAQRRDLVRLILREGLSMTATGIGLGMVGAALVTGLMRELLFGITPLDPITFALAPLVLFAAAIGACVGPALRAGATDPAATLRAQ
jgi:putative ABC transport system permease protein